MRINVSDTNIDSSCAFPNVGIRVPCTSWTPIQVRYLQKDMNPTYSTFWSTHRCFCTLVCKCTCCTCKQVGISCNKTNSSLWATSATQMYDSIVSEETNAGDNRHPSLQVLRMYKRMYAKQHQEVSVVLSNSDSCSSFYHQSEKMTVFQVIYESVCCCDGEILANQW